jgi:hypothetical protein
VIELAPRAAALREELNWQASGLGDKYAEIELNPSEKSRKRPYKPRQYTQPWNYRDFGGGTTKRQGRALSSVTSKKSTLPERTIASREMEIVIRGVLEENPEWFTYQELADLLGKELGRTISTCPRGSFSVALSWLDGMGVLQVIRRGNKNAVRYVAPCDRIFRRGSMAIYLPSSPSEQVCVVMSATLGEHGPILTLASLATGIEFLASPDTTTKGPKWAELPLLERAKIDDTLLEEIRMKYKKQKTHRTESDLIIAAIQGNPDVTLAQLCRIGNSPRVTRDEIDRMLRRGTIQKVSGSFPWRFTVRFVATAKAA